MSTLRTIGRLALGAFLLVAGMAHLGPARHTFQAQVPSWVPVAADLVVVLSGVVEILLGAALGLASLVGGNLPGTDAERTVLRTYVQPPFDITQYPSPLVGFRKYTEGAKKVWDQELFSVQGAQSGSLIRIAVLDDYSGTVWSAAGTSGGSGFNFRKVGGTIAPVEGVGDGTSRSRLER